MARRDGTIITMFELSIVPVVDGKVIVLAFERRMEEMKSRVKMDAVGAVIYCS